MAYKFCVGQLKGLSDTHILERKQVCLQFYMPAPSVVQDFGRRWRQNLSFHPHIHCLVPAAGITLRYKRKSAAVVFDFLFSKSL